MEDEIMNPACSPLIAAAALLAVWAVPATASYEAGIDAYYAEDFEAAYDELAPLAEQGSADAQYRLGLMFENGQGVEKDHQKAAELLRLAAVQAHTDAQFALGIKYMEGMGVPFSPIDAHYWIRQAANRGNLHALQWLVNSGECGNC
jgi:TPR repeat protein